MPSTPGAFPEVMLMIALRISALGLRVFPLSSPLQKAHQPLVLGVVCSLPLQNVLSTFAAPLPHLSTSFRPCFSPYQFSLVVHYIASVWHRKHPSPFL